MKTRRDLTRRLGITGEDVYALRVVSDMPVGKIAAMAGVTDRTIRRIQSDFKKQFHDSVPDFTIKDFVARWLEEIRKLKERRGDYVLDELSDEDRAMVPVEAICSHNNYVKLSRLILEYDIKLIELLGLAQSRGIDLSSLNQAVNIFLYDGKNKQKQEESVGMVPRESRMNAIDAIAEPIPAQAQQMVQVEKNDNGQTKITIT